MNAKQKFLEQASIKQAKHPKTAPKVISFSLAIAFFGLSLIFIGVAHGIYYPGFTASWTKTILMIVSIITLQGAVTCSALGITSSRYALHIVSCVTLSLSLAIDIAFAIYYSILL